jgi:signal transduction histidine kinase
MERECGESKGLGRGGSLANDIGRFMRLPTNTNTAGPVSHELAQIVHDLKNPLSSIALETELLDARGVSCHGFDAGQAMARIRRNVRFLDRLIYDLVDVCTLSDGRFALRRTRCDLTTMIETVIDRVVPAADRHRVVLDAPYSVEALVDELRIERVVANLLDNALKYTPSTATIVVTVTREANSANVSVRDSGPGLSPADIALLFEPYRRGGSARGRSGTGLGLFVSKQIVEAHGGRIGVESVTGVGARFFFALPLV